MNKDKPFITEGQSTAKNRVTKKIMLYTIMYAYTCIHTFTWVPACVFVCVYFPILQR